jgi:deazaflavin-dependent oxidoreductase (nitroreductase family)
MFVKIGQAAGQTQVGVWFIGHVVSPLQRWLYRWTGGRVSLLGRAPSLLLTTTGRRSGKARTVPLFYVRDGDWLVVCNVNPGFERPNPWTLNIRAQPLVFVDVRGQRLLFRGRDATADEIDRYWPSLVGIWPAYRTFFEKGGSRSIFVLEPVIPATGS